MNVLLDPYIWIPLIGLMTTSLFLIGSTTPALLMPQALFFAFGIVLSVGFSKISLGIWRKFSIFIYILSICLLLLVFLGPNVRGAHRWFEVAGVLIQPSEILKPFLIVILAIVLHRFKPIKIRSIGIAIGVFIPILLLIFRQPDLGNAIVYAFFFIFMIIYAGMPWRYLITGVVCFVLLMPLFWGTLRGYQQDRIISFINPYADPVGAGYNALQAMIAIGSGQLYGLGLGRGTQSRLAFLPEYHTDFVYASIGEELGFIGGFLILVFYLILFLRLLSKVNQTDSTFEKYVVVGIFAQLFIQVFINVGMNIGLLPITGITLPLISYGGSSILSTFIDLGLVFALSALFKSPLVIR